MCVSVCVCDRVQPPSLLSLSPFSPSLLFGLSPSLPSLSFSLSPTVDQTKRPLRVPPDFATYAEEHDIFPLFEEMVKSLVIHRPSDMLQHVKEFLQLGQRECVSACVRVCVCACVRVCVCA